MKASFGYILKDIIVVTHKFSNVSLNHEPAQCKKVAKILATYGVSHPMGIH